MKTRIKTMLTALIFSISILFSISTSAVDSQLPLLSLKGGYAEENSITTVTASLSSKIDSAAAFSVSLYFDPSKLEFVDASFSRDFGNFYFGDSAEDCATLVWSDSKDRTLEGELFTVRFKTKSDTAGCTAPIDVGYTTFGNTVSDEFTVDTQGCEIIVTDEYMWGDANCDKTVSISDAVKITLFNVNPTKHPLSEIQLVNSDTDSNGIVDSKDANKIINHIIRP